MYVCMYLCVCVYICFVCFIVFLYMSAGCASTFRTCVQVYLEILPSYSAFSPSFHALWLIGERAKRARHSLVCSIENRGLLLGERSEPHTGVFNRDFAWYIIYVHVSVVCQINCVGGITCGPRACSKSFFLAVKNVTPVLFISYTLEL